MNTENCNKQNCQDNASNNNTSYTITLSPPFTTSSGTLIHEIPVTALKEDFCTCLPYCPQCGKKKKSTPTQ